MVKWHVFYCNEKKEIKLEKQNLQSYYIQINEIQENIDEMICIFQNVLFSQMKKYLKCYFTGEK